LALTNEKSMWAPRIASGESAGDALVSAAADLHDGRVGNARIFGTDGIRGRAGEGWLAAPAVSALGLAVGRLLPGRRALIGHDGRRSGPELERALAAGLAARGYSVTSTGLITTPGLAWLTRREGAELGAMISASHNPAEDNGIKLFSSAGDKLSDALEGAIEAELHAAPSSDLEAPAVALDPELAARYAAHLVESVGKGLDLRGFKLVIDAANGGGSSIAPLVLRSLGAEVVLHACSPNGLNINRDCGATHTAALSARVVAERASLGIALDGDGDRCMLIDERGALVDGDGILTVLAREWARHGQLSGGAIVATVMSNKGLSRALRDLGVRIVTCDVGDRRVVEALRREGLRLGGEQSGHIVFGPDNHYIGDGLYTALAVLRVMLANRAPLSGLAGHFRAFPQILVNVRVREKPPLSTLPRVGAAVRAVEEALGEDGRVLLRYSGTEALARVMVEGPEEALIRQQAMSIADELKSAIGA